MGADAALLIAAVLPNTDLAYLLKSATKLGLQVIIEVHTTAGAGRRSSPLDVCASQQQGMATAQPLPCMNMACGARQAVSRGFRNLSWMCGAPRMFCTSVTDPAWKCRVCQMQGLHCHYFETCACLAELERVLRLDLSNAMLGINNRNLEDFTVDLGNTRAIMQSPAGQEVGRALCPFRVICTYLRGMVQGLGFAAALCAISVL